MNLTFIILILSCFYPFKIQIFGYHTNPIHYYALYLLLNQRSISFVKIKKNTYDGKNQLMILSLFLLFTTHALFNGSYFRLDSSIKYILQIVTCLFLYLIIKHSNILNRQLTKKTTNIGVGLLCCIGVINGILDFQNSGNALPYLHYDLIESRSNENGQNVTAYGLTLVWCFLIVNRYPFTGRASLILIFFIITLGSRSSILTLLIILFSKSINYRFYKTILLSALTLIIAAPIILIEYDYSSHTRAAALLDGIAISKNNNLQGIGLDNFQYYTVNVKKDNNLSRQDAHNEYLKTLVEQGVIGLILLIVLLTTIFKSMTTNNKNIYCIVITIVIACGVGDFLWSSVTWAAIGIGSNRNFSNT